jgi:hypothetical protein
MNLHNYSFLCVRLANYESLPGGGRYVFKFPTVARGRAKSRALIWFITPNPKQLLTSEMTVAVQQWTLVQPLFAQNPLHCPRAPSWIWSDFEDLNGLNTQIEWRSTFIGHLYFGLLGGLSFPSSSAHTDSERWGPSTPSDADQTT